MGILQNLQKIRVRYEIVTELTEVPGNVARAYITHIRYKNDIPVPRVFVALANRTSRSSGYGNECPTELTEVICRVIPGVNTQGMVCAYPTEPDLAQFSAEKKRRTSRNTHAPVFHICSYRSTIYTLLVVWPGRQQQQAAAEIYTTAAELLEHINTTTASSSGGSTTTNGKPYEYTIHILRCAAATSIQEKYNRTQVLFMVGKSYFVVSTKTTENKYTHIYKQLQRKPRSRAGRVSNSCHQIRSI